MKQMGSKESETCTENKPRIIYLGKGIWFISKYNYEKELPHVLGIKGKKLKDIANGGNGTMPDGLWSLI
jgi:hypothetical protein